MPQLTQQHQQYMGEFCYALGMSTSEISAITGLSEVQVLALTQSPLFLAEVDKLKIRFASQLTSSAQQALHAEAIASIQALVHLRDNTMITPAVRLRAAESILDRQEETSKHRKISIESHNTFPLTDGQFRAVLDFMRDDPLAHSAFVAETQAEPETIELPVDSITHLIPELATQDLDIPDLSDLSPIAIVDEPEEFIDESLPTGFSRVEQNLKQFISTEEE
jgi:hypothetical protein